MNAQEALARLEDAILKSPSSGLVQLASSDAQLIAGALRAAGSAVVTSGFIQAQVAGHNISVSEIAADVNKLFEEWEHKT